MKPFNDRVRWPAPQTKLNFGLSPSVKQHSAASQALLIGLDYICA